MKDKRPTIMVCPVCGRHFVKRRNKSCPRCKTALYYAGEYMFVQSGYMFYPGRGWVKVEDLVSESIKRGETQKK